MKKLLLVAPIVLLLAAGCNASVKNSTNMDANNQTPETSASGRASGSASIKPTADVDKFIDTLNAQAQAQADATSGSDQDLVNTDSATLNSYSNVQ